MSAASFVGLLVTCTLKDQQSTTVEGVVSSIDSVQGTITLHTAEVKQEGLESQHVPYIVLSRNQVSGLQVKSVRRPSPRPSSGSRSTPKSGSNKDLLHPDSPVVRSPFAAELQLVPSLTAVEMQAPAPVPSGLSREFEQHSLLPESSSNRERTEEELPKVARARAKGGVRRKKTQRDRLDAHDGDDGDGVGEGNEADESAAPFDDEEPERRAIAGASSGVVQHPSRATPFDEDFDFDAGLRFFDKSKVFDQIRRQDDTDPALRLHAHNRNRALAKLAPNESVLSREELHEQDRQSTSRAPFPSQQQRRVAELPVEEINEYEEEERQPPPPAAVLAASSAPVARKVGDRERERKGNGKLVAGAKGKGFWTAQGGIKVVEVKLKQYKEALSIADIETGPTLEQRTENASRGITSFILCTLSRDRQIFPIQNRKRPTVCIICDDCEKGAVALRAGVHLSNHGAQVCAFILAKDDHSDLFRNNLRVLSSAGGRIIRDLEDLAQYDLIIDAIADNEAQSTLDFKSKSTEAIAAATWASESRIPILSIDSPFGLDHDTGLPTSTSSLKPSYILCRGVVRMGCSAATTQSASPEVVLVDVGFFPSVWARVGAEEWSDYGTFGPEFVVPLKRGD